MHLNVWEQCRFYLLYVSRVDCSRDPVLPCSIARTEVNDSSERAGCPSVKVFCLHTVWQFFPSGEMTSEAITTTY